MSSKAVRDAFRTKLEALAPENAAIPFKDSVNTARQDDAATPYMTAEFPASLETRLSMGNPGNDWWRETGTVRLVCRVPRGDGVGGATDPEAAFDAIANGLRGQILPGIVRIEGLDPIDTTLSDDQHFRAALNVRFSFKKLG